MNTDALVRNHRRTILIVEDEAVNRELLGFILADHYDVLYAGNGREALHTLRTCERRIAMVLLDINMPEMNGIEMLEIMRGDAKLAQVPVIVLTSDKDAELQTLRLGALDFITKPYDMPEIILARVRRIIEFVEDRQIIRDVEQDELTNLYTRRFFYQYCRQLLEGEPGPVRDMVALDVDHFRLINEVNGKEFGDALLCAIADGIREVMRPLRGIGCRCDGDQFYLFIERTDDYDGMRDAVQRHILALGSQNNIRLRMGVYRGVEAGRDISWYCDAAKSACSAIRNNYTQAVMVYDDALHERELFNERLIAEVDEAIRSRQFEVYFQPKYNIQGDAPRLYSAEALVRWRHPELGFISPGTFIPLFEENGLVMRLDHYVWNEVAARIRRWRERWGVDFPVSVNLSRMDFFDASLKQRLQDIAAANGVPVRDIVLEVTESAYSQNMDLMLKTIGELREAGFQIEMDDFGSGYSSLNMLCVMPVDALKVDMKFVRNIVASGSGYRMAELVIEIARCLSVPAVVEGVEDEDQYRLVKQVGCDVVQGYYFSKPLPAGEFEALLQRDLEERRGGNASC